MFQRIIFLTSLFTLLSCSIVRAELVVDVSFGPVTDPIQSSGIFNVGDTVTANIFLQVDGLGFPVSTSLSAYNFSLRFDPTMLGFVNLSQIKTTFAGLVSNSAIINNVIVDPFNSARSILTHFEGASSTAGTGAFPSNGRGLVGSAQFTVLAPLAGGSTLITAGLFDNNNDLFFNVGDQLIADGTVVPKINNGVSFNGATVSAVPEPTSMALVAVIGLVGIAHRRFRKTATV